MYPAEFHLQTLHLQWLELYSLFPWLFHPFRLLQKSCCLSKFQEESFWEDISSVKGPVDQSSPLCKYRRCCVYCLYSNWVQDILFASNLIPGEGNGKPLQYSCLKIPWMEEPGRLRSMGSLWVRRDWATSLSLFTITQWRRQWQRTPVFLPGDSQGPQSLVGCRLWGRTESDMTEAT